MVPRSEALTLLADYGKGAAWTKHCYAVAESAAKLGHLLEIHHQINQPFLWSAALLHDIGRSVTHDPIMHGVEGYHLLMALAHPEEAFVCASHILFGLSAAEATGFGLPDRDFVPQTIEQRLVALIDFMIEGERPTTLERRFESLRKRNAGNAFFLGRLETAHEKARLLLIEFSEEIGSSIEELIGSQGQP